MAYLSKISGDKKLRYFFDGVPKDARILEVGSGSGWVGRYLKNNGWKYYTGLDVTAPADIVGDLKEWRKLGIKEGSFDIIAAFEVVEHGDFFNEFHDILKPGGKLFLTTPVPHMDWFLKILEAFKLNQKRTSAHDHLTYINTIPGFKTLSYKRILGLAQWGRYEKEQ